MEVLRYLPGNRTALKCVVDRYQVSKDERSGIKSDANCADDEDYIVRLVGQLTQDSLETVKFVAGLPQVSSGDA